MVIPARGAVPVYMQHEQNAEQHKEDLVVRMGTDVIDLGHNLQGQNNAMVCAQSNRCQHMEFYCHAKVKPVGSKTLGWGWGAAKRQVLLSRGR